MVHWQNPAYPRVIPWLCATPAAEAITFYQTVLGASERTRIETGGKIVHSEQMFGDCVVIVSDEFPDMGIVSPTAPGGSPVTIWVQVPDADAIHAAARTAGATATFPMTNMPYGDRAGGFTCPYGHHWFVATHVEDISPEEIHTRMKAAPRT